MSSLKRDVKFLILQYLAEEKFESVHVLEQEFGIYFNMKYFEEKVLAGEWDEVEKYLSGFTKVGDNTNSTNIFFEIRKHKYLEALDRQDKAKALEILVNDLNVFSTFSEDVYKDMTQLLTLKNFRENTKFSNHDGDTKAARSRMWINLKKFIEANPLFSEKLAFPILETSRLRTLINQSLNRQHQLLSTDQSCGPNPVSLLGAAEPKPTELNSSGVSAANASALARWRANPAAASSVQAPVVTASSLPIPTNQVRINKRPITLPSTLGMVDYPSAEHEQSIQRLRLTQSVEKVTCPMARQQASRSLHDLPRTVAFSLHLGSTVTTMDFHPSHHTLLLVGSHNGDVSLWEVAVREKLVTKPFKIWDLQSCSLPFQASVAKEAPFSVNRVTWSPDGLYLGAAFSKRLVHLYGYSGPNDVRQHLQIDAHSGGVNDLAFDLPDKQLCIITCGDDKLIKVWDLKGRKLLNFEGHEAPVYSICPREKENIQYILSTDIDGNIKGWLYDNLGCRISYDAPGHWCATMLHSADGSRLFSCGTSKDGDTFLVEWDEISGAKKKIYTGFRKKSTGAAQFDTCQNHYLAVGADSQIKFWDMDSVASISSTDADGGLPSQPRIRFNKEGNLLAVSTADNGIKLLANAAGLRSLRSSAAIKASGSSSVAQGNPALQLSLLRSAQGKGRLKSMPPPRH